MPSEYVVAAFLMVAGLAVTRSPMPLWIRLTTAGAYAYLGIVYIIASADVLTMATRATLLRWGLIVLSSVVILSGLSWIIGGMKTWRR
jgi:hypothetical protein